MFKLSAWMPPKDSMQNTLYTIACKQLISSTKWATARVGTVSAIHVYRLKRREKEEIRLFLLLLMCEQRWLWQVAITVATQMTRCGGS